jgi:hypothetical protein
LICIITWKNACLICLDSLTCCSVIAYLLLSYCFIIAQLLLHSVDTNTAHDANLLQIGPDGRAQLTSQISWTPSSSVTEERTDTNFFPSFLLFSFRSPCFLSVLPLFLYRGTT